MKCCNTFAPRLEPSTRVLHRKESVVAIITKDLILVLTGFQGWQNIANVVKSSEAVL
jgi:hypothetical protein